MSTPRFDLVDIVQTIRQRRRFVLIVTAVAAVIAAGVAFTSKKKYSSKAQFFIANPLLTDRNAMFGGGGGQLDYFATEDDIDRVIALLESDTVVVRAINESGYAADQKLDLQQPEQLAKAKAMFLKNIHIKRTEYTMVEVSFTDEDAQRSAHIANTTVRVLEEAYRGFYRARKVAILTSLENKFREQDSTINSLSDTLAVLRDESGIYDLISPNRNNLVTSSMSPKGANMGRYVEYIQNVEAIKDGIVIDQTRIATLMQQFSTGTGEEELNMFHIISNARPPLDPKGPGLVITLTIGILLGLFFSSLYVLLTTYYKKIITVER
jgi:uncharacterized protein involved in exopolysaccharide biosynthesis